MKNTIKSRRKSLKLSQAELSELTSVTRQTINAIENEKYDPSLELAFKLAKVLRTTVDELFIYGRDSK
ncbi:helix-turn-helix transcriptional regulator [Lentilactobacillus fungorum]|uniref:helix-turn-helix transcriptional regulator n=1 Tax=Lentilactobacillus fungorum TaxID=2201250 RepID=UPI001943D5FF|nr:helix-turn-helix transcriptional regulator [Lentilactobacillus fungorum]